MIGKFLKSLYNKIFVNIVINNSKIVVYVEECNSKDTIRSNEQTFPALNEKTYDFIESYVKESPYNYISYLDNSREQGAAPTCDREKMADFFNVNASKYLCVDKKWTYYTSNLDLSNIQREYKQVGVDFIFSPFVVLSKFFQDKIESHLALFVLVQEKVISLMVFDNSELLFAEYLNMDHHKDFNDFSVDYGDDEDIELDLEKSIDLDEGIDLEDVGAIDDIEDLGDIEDLDSFEEIEEFSEEESEDVDIGEDKAEGLNEESFGEDYQRFLLIQNSINKFYKDKKYKSKFIESIYVAKEVELSNEFKKYFEEEMFLNIYIRQIDIAFEICELAKEELS